MMLLTAFVLVIDFVALSGMVARATQLPEATQAAADRPIYIEAAAVARGVETLMEDLNSLVPVRADGTNVPAYTQAVADSLEHLVILESARGYRLQLDPANPPGCDDTTTPGQAFVHATFSLADTETTISFTITYDIYDPWSNGPPSTDPQTTWTDGYIITDPTDADVDAPVTSCT